MIFCFFIKLLTPVSEAIRHLKERHPTDSEYQDLPEPAQGQSITDYIDAWSIAEFLGITGQWKEEDIIAPNRLRATFPRRHGGMGFTTLRDVLPEAFAATIEECLYPRGLTALGAPKREGISLRAGCPAIARMIPHWSLEDRRAHIPANATPTQKLYLLSVPIRLPQDMTTSMSPDGTTETLTADFKEALQSLQDLASHPRIRCLLYGNKILKEIGRLENNLSGNSMVFGTNSLMYEQVPNNDPASKGISEDKLNAQLDPQASSDQITTQILTQTKAGIILRRGQGAQDAAIPEALTTGAALVLILAAGSSRDPVDWRNIGYGCNLPVSRRRLQRDFNRAVLETKVGFFRTFTQTMQTKRELTGRSHHPQTMGERNRAPRVQTPLEIPNDAPLTLPKPRCQPAG